MENTLEMRRRTRCGMDRSRGDVKKKRLYRAKEHGIEKF